MCWCTARTRSGKDAGEIAGIAPIGVAATDDIESVIAMDADCVFYTPVIMDVETVCRLLHSGKNVVTTSGFFYPSVDFAAEAAKIREACEAGSASFHAGASTRVRGRHTSAHTCPHDEQD